MCTASRPVMAVGLTNSSGRAEEAPRVNQEIPVYHCFMAANPLIEDITPISVHYRLGSVLFEKDTPKTDHDDGDNEVASFRCQSIEGVHKTPHSLFRQQSVTRADRGSNQDLERLRNISFFCKGVDQDIVSSYSSTSRHTQVPKRCRADDEIGEEIRPCCKRGSNVPEADSLLSTLLHSGKGEPSGAPAPTPRRGSGSMGGQISRRLSPQTEGARGSCSSPTLGLQQGVSRKRSWRETMTRKTSGPPGSSVGQVLEPPARKRKTVRKDTF
ncbi:uncharacterized protein LOC134034311 [Osmerus eperlanus]|uniref:uncharacterized protein LOC134034311 n=1 Tax=Osmerus eperlanus TaxID=29151 RepID=UPI002E11E6F7